MIRFMEFFFLVGEESVGVGVKAIFFSKLAPQAI
jgi:hypothetical protein